MLRSSLVLSALVQGGACFAATCADPGDTLFDNGFETSPGVSRYVSPNGADTHDGSWQAPWRTVQHAADSVAAGDTVCVRGGTYNEIVTISHGGSVAAGDIAFQAWPGESVRIDGSGLAVPNGQWGLVTLQDVGHVTVRGFDIANFSTASTAAVPIGIYVTGAGTGIHILDNHIHDIRTSASGCAANAFGLKVDGTNASASIDQLTIAGNEVDHLVLGCSESLSLDGNVEHWSISGNSVHDTDNIAIGAIGFEGVAPDPAVDQARDGVISGNTVYNISSFGNPAYGNQYAADGIYVDGGTRITIERNLVHHVDLGIEAASEHSGRTSSYVIVRDNLVHSGNSAGISIGGYAANRGGSDHVTIVNNTLFHNDGAATGSGEFQIQYHADANLFENNIVAAGAQGLLVNAYTGDTPAPATLDHNLYFADGGGATWNWRSIDYASFDAWQAGSGQDAQALFGDPLFANPAIPDLRVGAQSPAVDAGADLGPSVVGTLDYAGQPRVQGAAIDIGAYERWPGSHVSSR